MTQKPMELRGLRENNLKNISLDLPKGKLVVFTGVSGSGKSSVVFDTLAVEAQRQLNETFPLYVRNRMPHYEPPRADRLGNLTPAIVIDQRPVGTSARSTVGTMTDIAPLLRLLFSRCGTPSAGPSSAYSFNDPTGACPVCGGLGERPTLDLDKILDRDKSLNEGAIRFKPFGRGNWQFKLYANCGRYDPDKPLRDFTPGEWEVFLHGSGFKVQCSGADTKFGDTPVSYEGLVDRFNRLYLNRDISALSKGNQASVLGVVATRPCPACHGNRLNEAALATRVDGYGIAELCRMEIDELVPALERITHPLRASMLPALLASLRRICALGLGYLHLGRRSDTLSGGEAQRLKMVRHLGSSLTDMTYILDEPSVGLHPRDVARLGAMLCALRDKGNTVLVVEHDRDIIALADEVVEMGPGPGPGAAGGRVLFQGSVAGLLASGTPTSDHLRDRPSLKASFRAPAGWFPVEDVSVHNLKNVSVSFPAGVLCAVSGVAGSGKSTLVRDAFLPRYPQAIYVDQSPVGANARSTPATYVGVMDDIRALFAKENGVSASLFSFNSGGACPVCGGKGELLPDMAFADPVAIPCEACGGKRYGPEALRHRLGGKTILDVLDMTVTEALGFFGSEKIAAKLQVLEDVGLSYLTLGQPTGTLSGGECQRIKLASELHRAGKLYILDEPTTGLHMADIQRLLALLDRLVDRGNSVIVIEHNLDVIAHCDWVIDLGPEAGRAGGELLFCGTPAALLDCARSHTARSLREAVESERFLK